MHCCPLGIAEDVKCDEGSPVNVVVRVNDAHVNQQLAYLMRSLVQEAFKELMPREPRDE